MAYLIPPHNSKIWHMRFKNPDTGKWQEISLKTKDEKTAKKLLKEQNALEALGVVNLQLIQKPPQHILSLADAFDKFLEHKRYTAKSIRAYKIPCLKFAEITGNKRLYAYTQEDYDIYLRFLFEEKVKIIKKKGSPDRKIKYYCSDNTIANYTRHLHSFFNYLVEKKYIKKNIISRTKAQKKDPRPIPPIYLNRIFEYIKSNRSRAQYNFIRLIYFLALRANESFAINRNSFDLDNNNVTINNFKGKRPDRIPLLADTKELISQMDFNKKVFTTYSALRSFWQRVVITCKKNGLIPEEYTLHQIRKARGTDLANSGVKPLQLQMYMRHENFEVTKQYYIDLNLDIARMDMDISLLTTTKLPHSPDPHSPAQTTNTTDSK